jgi:hypothetical protein
LLSRHPYFWLARTFQGNAEGYRMSPTQKPAEARQFMRRADASNYIEDRYGIRCSKQTLAKLAVGGGGPLFRKAGRTPIYAPDDLDRWAQAQIGPAQRSTARREGSTAADEQDG